MYTQPATKKKFGGEKMFEELMPALSYIAAGLFIGIGFWLAKKLIGKE